MSKWPTDKDISQILNALEDVVSFAYDHGYHEHGYPLVKTLREWIDMRQVERRLLETDPSPTIRELSRAALTAQRQTPDTP